MTNRFEELAAELARIRGENVVPLRSEIGVDDYDRIPDAAYGGYAYNEFAPPPAPERTSAFFSASELAGQPVPERHWLASDLIPSGTVTLLGGDGGTGKSLIALQLAVAVAARGWWLGRQVVTGPAVYLSAEDDRDELHRRLHDITRAEQIGLDDLDRLSIRSLAGEDALLATLVPGTGILAGTALHQEISGYVEQQSPAVVILDTLADLFAGSENDRGQARQFISLMRGMAIRNSCAVILLSHPSLTGLNSGSGSSGSTAWSNSVRSRLYLERVLVDGDEADPDARVLTTKKSNYARTGGEIAVHWRDGVFVPDAPSYDSSAIGSGMKAERVFLRLLAQFVGQGRHVNHAGGNSYAPNVFAAHPASEGVSKRGFQVAMDTLLAEGRLRIVASGPDSKRRTHLEIV